MNLRNMLYTGILLIGTAIATLLNSCASSSRLVEQEFLRGIKQISTMGIQEKRKELHIKDSLDNLVNMSISYKDEPKSKILYGKTGERAIPFYNPVVELTPEEYNEVQTVFDSIKTSTYNEFISGLSNLNEKQTTVTLSFLAKILKENLYKDGNSNLNSEEVYLLTKDFLNGNRSVKESIICGHVHNFVSETARRAGMPEAIAFSCEKKGGGHVASAIWWSDGTINLIDYEEVYAGNSDLESVLREYQRIQKIPAFSHKIYKKENHLFTFTTSDGNIFYKAIGHPKDTAQLKEILTNNRDKKPSLETRLGNTENSVQCSKNKWSCKIGHIQGADNPAYWGVPIFQVGYEDSTKNLKYNLSFLTIPVKNYPVTGVSGNVIYEKKTNLTPSDKLSIAGQLTSLTDLTAFSKKTTLISDGDWLSSRIGINYAHTFDKKTKSDIYTIIGAEPARDKIITENIKLIISELRAGCGLTSGDVSINPEYTYERQSDTLSLETGWRHRDLEIGFALSTSNTKYKKIWPDKNSLRLSATYSSNDVSIGGAVEYAQKKWGSCEKYSTEVKFYLEKKF